MKTDAHAYIAVAAGKLSNAAVAKGEKKVIKKFAFSAVLGWVALAALQALQGITGLCVPVSLLSVGVSGVLGMPGVALLLVLNTFL